MNIKNTADLRVLLLETIEGVKSGGIEPKKAQAIAGLAGKILQSSKIDLEVLKFKGTLSMENTLQLTSNTIEP